MSLARRMTLAMFVLAVTTAIVVGVLGYYSVYRIIVPTGLRELQLQNQRFAAVIETDFRGVRNDVLTLASLPAVKNLFKIQADPSTSVGDDGEADKLRAQVAHVFLASLEVRLDYLQLRLIGADPEGREIVRVDREALSAPARIVPREELQDKSDRPYYIETMKLPFGSAALSNFELNEEYGLVQVPHTPVLRVSTPCYLDPDAAPVGMIIVNIGIGPALDRARVTVSPGNDNYLLNANGGILIHPKRIAEFAFNLGETTTIKDIEPELAALMNPEKSQEGIITTSDGVRRGAAVTPEKILGGPLIYLIKTRHYEAMVAPANALAAPILAGGTIATLLALLIAILFAKRVTAPLRDITAAITRYAETGDAVVPQRGSGEVRELASAFETMAQDLEIKNSALIEEIDRRRRSEAELFKRGESLTQAEERFRRVVESAPSGMIVVDKQGKIIIANKKIQEMFDYTQDEILGNSIELLVPKRYRDKHVEVRAHYIEAPETRAMGKGRDLYGLRKDGAEFPVEIGLTPIETEQGIQILGVVVDITDRKKSEEAIAKYTEDLQRSNAELEQFAYIASHDLQEPLRMVASYTELLGERYRGKLDEKADKYIFYAVDGATRMKLLISDLLTFSRVGSQAKPFEAVPADMVLVNVLRSLKERIADVQGTITSEPLPIVYVDEVQLGQVFQNLIGNALKFHGQTPPNVHVSATITKGMALFTIRDNGIGIEEKYNQRIFQMFQRLHSRSDYTGNGIGLAVVKKIIERHGGQIWLDSKPGVGTTFHFTLPLPKETPTP